MALRALQSLRREIKYEAFFSYGSSYVLLTRIFLKDIFIN